MTLDPTGWAAPGTTASPYYPPAHTPKGSGDRFARYVLHGLMYTLLGFFLGIILAIMTVILTLCGWFIGLMIAIVIIVLSIGYLNTFVDRWIWNDDLQVNLAAVFLHGLVLIIVLLLASIPQFILEWSLDTVAVSIVLFLIYLPINGFLAHWVAQNFARGGAWAR